MESNQFYYSKRIEVIYYNTKKGVKICKKEYPSVLKYGIVPQNNEWICKNFDDKCIEKRSRMGKRYIIDFYHDNFFQTNIKEDEFVQIVIRFQHKKIDGFDFSIKELMERLTAAEFIYYLKDNGIGNCPNK